MTYKNGLKVLKESGEPFSGKSIRFEGGEIPSEIIEYKEGKLDGNIQLFYANGEIKEDFHARVRNEFYMIAQAFGQRNKSRDTNELDEIALKSLIRYGKEHKWHDNGEMASEGEYSEDGTRKVGEWRQWYKNGELEQEGSYSLLPVSEDSKTRRRRVDGVKTGEWKRWYKDGELNTEAYYNKDGQKDGIWKTYCNNGNVGKEEEFKAGTNVGTKKYWACDGKELDQISYAGGKQHGRFVTYVTKKRTALDTLINTVDYGGKVEYDVKSEDYYKAKQGFFDNGEKSGIWTTWDKTGKVTSITDYSMENFLNTEYSKAFLKKGKFGPFATRNGRWSTNYYNFKDAKPNFEETQLYLKRKLINPAKKIITKGRGLWGQYDAGVSHWTYPVIVAPEALYDVIKAYPQVKLDVVDTQGKNRLHLCTILMLGRTPGRCSIEHFKLLVADIPVNNADHDGMTAMNYVAEPSTYRSRRKALSTEETAVDAINILVKAGADINHQNAKGQTTLMRALSHKKYNIAKTLLDLGADVNLKDLEGHNVMHFVFFHATSNTYRYSFKLNDSRKEILTLLVQKGAKIDMPDLNNKTIKDIAIQKGAITTALFLETLSELKVDKKIKPVEVEAAIANQDNQTVQKAEVKAENTESFFSSSQVETVIDSNPGIPADKVLKKAEMVPEKDVLVNLEEQLYQKALSQIKRSRLSKPKGDSALDTLNQLSELTSNNDSRVVELRQKIVDRYLSLAKGRINDYRYQDAVKFIKTSQRIQPSKQATQLMARVEDKIAEEQLFQQQQQKINATKQAPPVQEKSSFGTIFKSIFD